MINCGLRQFPILLALALAALLCGCGGGSSGGAEAPPPQLAPKSLDPNFGAGGIVLSPGISFESNAVLLQPDGKIVVAGSNLSGSNPAITSNFVVVRYNADGSLDSAFGEEGKAITPIETGPDQPRRPVYSAALQPDGKIVVLGVGGSDIDKNLNCVFARYSVDGTLDAAFGVGGRAIAKLGVKFPSNGYHGQCFAIAIEPDGRIVAAGDGFVAMRLNADGSRDRSFGAAGSVYPPESLHFIQTNAASILIQPDGKIVLTGGVFYAVGPGGTTFLALTRYDINGNLDSDFGDAGAVSRGYMGVSYGPFVAGTVLQPDAKLVTQGYTDLQRFNTSGIPDQGFGNAGYAMSPPFPIHGGAVALQPNGKIVVAGSGFSSPKISVARYRADGNMDAGFGAGGAVSTAVGTAAAAGNAVAVQPDGKIVVAGSATVSDQPSVAVVRYFGDPAGPATP